MDELDKLSPTHRSATKNMFAEFKILNGAGGELLGKQVVDEIWYAVELSDWKK